MMRLGLDGSVQRIDIPERRRVRPVGRRAELSGGYGV